MSKYLPFLLLGALALLTEATAQSRTNELNPNPDPRGEPELVVCSQNLENYGVWDQVRSRGILPTEEAFRLREAAIVTRFLRAGCDVIAVQEILGSSPELAQAGIKALGDALRKRSGRFWETRVGETRDNTLRTGFLVAKDRAELLAAFSYNNVELPKLTEKQKPRFFRRAPFEIQLNVRPRGETFAKTVALVNVHFKSQAGGKDDPTSLEWETYRMEMSEAVRRVVQNRHARAMATGETVVLILGDRNSNFDTASARILEGVLTLAQFQEKGGCRLSKRGVPLCQAQSNLPQRFFSVLTTDPQTKQIPGTFLYNNIYSWLDDILMPSESLRFAWDGFDSAGDYASGVLSDPKDASDHALVYVRLNW